jgi:hypothetical protein
MKTQNSKQKIQDINFKNNQRMDYQKCFKETFRAGDVAHAIDHLPRKHKAKFKPQYHPVCVHVCLACKKPSIQKKKRQYTATVR